MSPAWRTRDRWERSPLLGLLATFAAAENPKHRGRLVRARSSPFRCRRAPGKLHERAGKFVVVLERTGRPCSAPEGHGDSRWENCGEPGSTARSNPRDRYRPADRPADHDLSLSFPNRWRSAQPSARAPHCRKLLVRHDDNAADGFDPIQHGRIRSRHVEHDKAIMTRRRTPTASNSRAHRGGVTINRSDDARRSTPDFVFVTAREKMLVETMRVLERVDDRKPGLGAEEDAASPLASAYRQQCAVFFQVGQRRRYVHGDSGRPDAALGADERERFADARGLAVGDNTGNSCLEIVGVTGSETNSLTPERIASSSSAGSSRDATITTPVVGCWRFRSGNAAGRCA